MNSKNNYEEYEKTSRLKIIFGSLILILCIVTIACSAKLVENVPAGQYIVKQSAISGDLEVWDDPGWKMQMFADLTVYNRSNQLWFSATKDGVKLPPEEDKSMLIRFSDGGKARISGSIRYSLPTGEKLLELHRTYRDAKAIHNDLIIPMIQKSINLAGPSMTSKESAAAKRNELLAIIEDQITNGAYRTVTEKRVIEDIDGSKKTVDVMVPLHDDNAPNGIARVEESPAAKYGIVFSSFAINDIIYEERVDKAIQKQYELEMEVQTSITASKTAEQNKKTAEAQGEANKTKAEWEEKTKAARQVVIAERDKKVAETKAAEKLEVAKLAKAEAEELKKATILRAEGEARAQELMANARKKMMEADNALEAKLKTYEAVQKYYANALGKINLPSTYIGGNNGDKTIGSNLTTFTDLLTIKAAKDLSLDMSISK